MTLGYLGAFIASARVVRGVRVVARPLIMLWLAGSVIHATRDRRGWRAWAIGLLYVLAAMGADWLMHDWARLDTMGEDLLHYERVVKGLQGLKCTERGRYGELPPDSEF